MIIDLEFLKERNACEIDARIAKWGTEPQAVWDLLLDPRCDEDEAEWLIDEVLALLSDEDKIKIREANARLCGLEDAPNYEGDETRLGAIVATHDDLEAQGYAWDAFHYLPSSYPRLCWDITSTDDDIFKLCVTRFAEAMKEVLG